MQYKSERKKEVRLPNLGEVALVLIGFLGLAFAFTSLGIEIHLAIFAGWFLTFAVGLRCGHNYEKMQQQACEGIFKGMDAIIILLVVGALVGTWISGGVVPALIYYGLKTIHPSIFLLATLIICSLTSISTGTSWGTAGTAGIAMMGIGAGLGVPAPMTAGAVLSGAYFGDKLSPLSDSTVLTASMSGVDLIDHVKGMMPVSIPAYILAGIAFTIAGFTVGGGEANLEQINEVMAGIENIFNINIFCLLPMFIVVGLLMLRLPSIPVITFGAILGIVWGILFQDLSPVTAVSTAWSQIPKDTGMGFIDNILSRGGMNSMLWSVGIILFGLGFGGLLGVVGILKVLARTIDGLIKGPGSISLATLIVGFFGNLFGSAMYVSLILTPKIMASKIDEMGYDRRVLSRNSEFGGTLTSGMVPWSDNGIFMAGLLGVPTLSYLPYMWLAFACIGISTLYGFTNKFMWKVDEEKAAAATAPIGSAAEVH